jgi:hypothetical protein
MILGKSVASATNYIYGTNFDFAGIRNRVRQELGLITLYIRRLI